MCKHNWKELTNDLEVIEWCRKCGVVKTFNFHSGRFNYFYPLYQNQNPERDLTKVADTLKKVYRKPLEEALS